MMQVARYVAMTMIEPEKRVSLENKDFIIKFTFEEPPKLPAEEALTPEQLAERRKWRMANSKAAWAGIAFAGKRPPKKKAKQ